MFKQPSARFEAVPEFLPRRNSCLALPKEPGVFHLAGLHGNFPEHGFQRSGIAGWKGV